MKDLTRAKKLAQSGGMAFGHDASLIVIQELEAGRKLAQEIRNYVEHGPNNCDPSFLTEALQEHANAVDTEPPDRG